MAPLDAGLEGTTAFLAMEYVAAETLDVALRHLAPMSLDRALPLLAQAADAAEAARAAGFGHGALHPRDIFVAPDTNDVRVTGFGIVQALDALGIKSPVRRPYTAPERVAGDAWDERADVFSLGSVAHELLTRRRPGGSGEQDGALIAGTTPEQRVSIRRVLSAALAENPEHRFGTARAFVDALGSVARGEALPALPELDAVQLPDVPKRETKRKAKDAETRPLFVNIDTPVDEPPADQKVGSSEDTAPVEAVREPPLPADVEIGRSEYTDGPRTAESEPLPTFSAEVSDPDESRMWPESPTFGAALPSEASFMAQSPSSNPFPWSAVAAVAVAGIALGGMLGYQYGRRSVAPAAPETTAIRPADTEVPVQPEPPRRDDAAATSEKPAEAPPPAARAIGPSPAAAAEARRTGARGLGSIFVDSRPRAARVIIDGRFVGLTPLRVPELSVGGHTVRLDLSGHRSFSTRTTVKGGEQTRVTASLEER